MELPGGIDTSALLQESSTDPAVNVAFVAGEGFFSDRDGQGKNCVRMSFGNTPEEDVYKRQNPDCLLTNSNVYGVTIPEHVVMVTLMLLRRMPEYIEIVRGHGWSNQLPVRSIRRCV